jgi:hypothetical protein
LLVLLVLLLLVLLLLLHYCYTPCPAGSEAWYQPNPASS